MYIDIHIHTSNYSSCGKSSIEEMVKQAKSRKLDAIFITDHESRGALADVDQLAEKYNIPILVGYEHLTKQGDIVVLGVSKMPAEQLTVQELITFVHEHGGLTIAAHPYRKNQRGLGDCITNAYGLDGVEAFNGNTSWENNSRAAHIAQQLEIPLLGGSDAHHVTTLGRYATFLPGHVFSWDSFKRAVVERRVCPAQWVEQDHCYQKINV